MMLAHVAPWLQDQFRDPELVFAVELGQIPRQDALELDLGGEALRVHLARTSNGRLGGSLARSCQQGRQGQRSKGMQDVAPRRLLARHDPSSFSRTSSEWITLDSLWYGAGDNQYNY